VNGVGPDPRPLVEHVRTALIDAALTAYEDAAIRGVCADGAWEVAITAMRKLDLSRIPSTPA